MRAVRDEDGPREKIGKGFGKGAGSGSEFQLAESEQSLDVLLKKGPPVAGEVLGRWRRVNQEECLSAMFFTVFEFERVLEIF